MPDEGDPQFPIRNKSRLVSLTARGVTAELRTNRPNCDARLRRAGFRSVALIIPGGWPAYWMKAGSGSLHFSPGGEERGVFSGIPLNKS